jgi:hypothetical protein
MLIEMVTEVSSPRKDNIPLFPKPLEIKVADVLFSAVRKNLMLFKDLGNEHIHYSIARARVFRNQFVV